MSSGVEADIVLDATVVLTLGMNRALGRAAGLAGRGAEVLAALAADRAEARAAALAEARTYERALREVIERNARVAALAGTRAKLGAEGAVPLPGPLAPADQTPAELAAWCTATDAALDAAERRLSEHLAAEVSAQVFTAPAEGLRADTGRVEPPPPRRDGLADAHRTLERVLARLLPDASEDERRSVAEAAGLLAGIGTAEEAEAALVEVRLRIQGANRRTEERREAERRGAAEREAAEQAEAERRYVLGSITSAFEEMGYEVDGGFETLTAGDGTVVLTRGGWPDHSVKMRIDDTGAPRPATDQAGTTTDRAGTATDRPGTAADGTAAGGVPGPTIRAAMVRERPARNEDDRRLDVEREREWCEAFEAARDRLAREGIRSDVTWRLEAGVHELPVSAEGRQTRIRPGRRERHREREK